MLIEETRSPRTDSWRSPVIRGQGDKEEPEKGVARKRKENPGTGVMPWRPQRNLFGEQGSAVSNAADGSAFR